MFLDLLLKIYFKYEVSIQNVSVFILFVLYLLAFIFVYTFINK